MTDTTDLSTDAGSLLAARQLWHRFCEDLKDDPGKARARLISGIQFAIRDAREQVKGPGPEADFWYEPLSHRRSGTMRPRR